MKARCYDKDFKYIPSGSTDLRVTFRRIRKQLAEEAAKRPAANVRQLAAKKASKP